MMIAKSHPSIPYTPGSIDPEFIHTINQALIDQIRAILPESTGGCDVFTSNSLEGEQYLIARMSIRYSVTRDVTFSQEFVCWHNGGFEGAARDIATKAILFEDAPGVTFCNT